MCNVEFNSFLSVSRHLGQHLGRHLCCAPLSHDNHGRRIEWRLIGGSKEACSQRGKDGLRSKTESPYHHRAGGNCRLTTDRPHHDDDRVQVHLRPLFSNCCLRGQNPKLFGILFCNRSSSRVGQLARDCTVSDFPSFAQRSALIRSIGCVYAPVSRAAQRLHTPVIPADGGERGSHPPRLGSPACFHKLWRFPTSRLGPHRLGPFI
ncbi:hypothetical protein EDB86DRAFT_2329262 [Lactarius hatsudake]|nr:hypothetical protein EDB86DRAFT_2329262 [Lactarius hatsudake]